MQFDHFGQQFILSESRAIFWVDKRILIIADAHLAKENHFRKSGIPIPNGILSSDLKKISSLTSKYTPAEVIFLGDMFHSEENDGLNEFLSWRKKQKDLHIKLVIGNHDILSKAWYVFAGIEVVEGSLSVENILLSHDRIKTTDADILNLSGHIHPCVLLHGKARQTLRLPCFWFAQNFGILPAFGRFTGCRAVQPADEDIVFGVGDGEIFEIKKTSQASKN